MHPRWLAAALALAAGAGGAAFAQEPAAVPAVGTMAPDFALTAATAKGVGKAPVRLSDLRGKTVVLAFFYQARTKG